MQKTGDNCIWYTYDENGLVTGFRYNGNEYYYFRNAQNDIIGIVNSSGSVVANYTYDSWGNHIAITDGNGNNVASNPNHIANINPFRYRGYYFDSETGLYYLQSRYYDANVGRFLNADGYVSTGQGTTGNNMFAYCLNNPVNLVDEHGSIAVSIVLIVSAVVNVVLSGLDMGISAKMNNQSFWKGFAAGSIGGLVGFGVSYFLGNQIFGRAAGTATTGVLNEWFQNGDLNNMNWGMYAGDILMDSTLSMMYAGEIADSSLSMVTQSALNGTTDALVDIAQTGLIYTDEAQGRIKGNNKKDISEIEIGPVTQIEITRQKLGLGKYKQKKDLRFYVCS